MHGAKLLQASAELSLVSISQSLTFLWSEISDSVARCWFVRSGIVLIIAGKIWDMETISWRTEWLKNQHKSGKAWRIYETILIYRVYLYPAVFGKTVNANGILPGRKKNFDLIGWKHIWQCTFSFISGQDENRYFILRKKIIMSPYVHVHTGLLLKTHMVCSHHKDSITLLKWIHIGSAELDVVSSRQSRILHSGWHRADKRYDEKGVDVIQKQGVMNDLHVSDLRPTQGVTSTSVSIFPSWGFHLAL